MDLVFKKARKLLRDELDVVQIVRKMRFYDDAMTTLLLTHKQADEIKARCFKQKFELEPQMIQTPLKENRPLTLVGSQWTSQRSPIVY